MPVCLAKTPEPRGWVTFERPLARIWHAVERPASAVFASHVRSASDPHDLGGTVGDRPMSCRYQGTGVGIGAEASPFGAVRPIGMRLARAISWADTNACSHAVRSGSAGLDLGAVQADSAPIGGVAADTGPGVRASPAGLRSRGPPRSLV